MQHGICQCRTADDWCCIRLFFFLFRRFSSPAKAADGHVLYSLNDIGYSLITGWDVSAAKAKDDKQVDSSGFNAQYMAKLVHFEQWLALRTF